MGQDLPEAGESVKGLTDFMRFFTLFYQPVPRSRQADGSRSCGLLVVPRHSFLPEISDVVLVPARALIVVSKLVPTSVADVIRFDQDRLAQDSTNVLFLLYQVALLVESLHRHSFALGCLDVRSLSIDASWTIRPSNQVQQLADLRARAEEEVEGAGKVYRLPNRWSLLSMTRSWAEGTCSNFDYLMALNAMAGRRLGDPSFHPILPWVSDLHAPFGGWRDLSKSKLRLTRGDVQLDVSWRSSSPHHVTELLSELTYCIYLARRLPRSRLLQVVRSQWQPHEYPSSLERLYAWTPDECIPEFFCDPQVFSSTHSDMPDLLLPSWAQSPHHFIEQHRMMLESDEVSASLHEWIDLTFGCKLVGQEAIDAKNVPLKENTFPSYRGFCVLFQRPHPPRRVSNKQKVANIERYLVSSDSSCSSRERPVEADHPVQVAEEEGGSETGTLKVVAEKKTKKSLFAGIRKAIGERVDMEMLIRPSNAHREVLGRSQRSSGDEGEGAERTFSSLGFDESCLLTDESNSAFLLVQDLVLMEASGCSGRAGGSCLGEDATRRDLNFVGNFSSYICHDNSTMMELILSDSHLLNDSLCHFPSVDFPLGSFVDSVKQLQAGGGGLGEEGNKSRAGSIPALLQDALEHARTSQCLARMLRSDVESKSKVLTSVQEPFNSDKVLRLGLLGEYSQSISTDVKSIAPGPAEPLKALSSHRIFPEYFHPLLELVQLLRCSVNAGMRREKVRAVLQDTHRASAALMRSPLLLTLLPDILQAFEEEEQEVDVLRSIVPIFCRGIGQKESERLVLPHLLQLISSGSKTDRDSKQEAMAMAGLLDVSSVAGWIDSFGVDSFLHSLLPRLLALLVNSPSSTVSSRVSRTLVGLTGEVLGEAVSLIHIADPLVPKLARDASGRVSGFLVDLGTKMGEVWCSQLLVPRMLAVLYDWTFGSTEGRRGVAAHKTLAEERSPDDSDGQRAGGAGKDGKTFTRRDSFLLILTTIEQMLPMVSSTSSMDLCLLHNSILLRLLTEVPVRECKQEEEGGSRMTSRESVMVTTSILCDLLGKSGPDAVRKHLLLGLANWLMSLTQIYSKGFVTGSNPLGLGGSDPSSQRGLSAESRSQLKLMYSADIVHDVYHSLLDLVPPSDPSCAQWQSTIRQAVRNHAFIESLVAKHASSKPLPTRSLAEDRRAADRESGIARWSGFGEQRQAGEGSIVVKDRSWEWTFNGALACSWKGHTGNVKCICRHPSERVFFTGSKDSTVRLWSPHNLNCEGMYTGHREPVTRVQLLPSRPWAVSLDTEIHVWDFEVLQRMQTHKGVLTSGHVASITSFACLEGDVAATEFWFGGNAILACTAKYPGPVAVKVVDLRSKSKGVEWHLPPALNNVLSIKASRGSIFMGTSTGQVCVMDLRSGVLQSTWRAHEGAITGLETKGTHVITASMDKSLAVWDSEGSEELLWSTAWLMLPRLSRWSGKEGRDRLYLTDPVVDLKVMPSSMAVAALAGGLVFADAPRAVDQSRMRDVRSNISCVEVLPYSRMILVGCEDGRVRGCQ
ncbi:hypothetical protein GUITHDRAFT_142321 [Guillardia theta CCMP2712]|uniref:BEACH domain-containing protein n=1 Tax=Guillardia theta (strain CCMP2712) TaxID=905079 RepID=L1IYL8_GUITC|nr:hypothetical protein GUITHDRAFT_142321 [Guillardia theta CCMP2712]EKX40920.1 hypothetical protein GUITHDRAFT_142321 [Guillardia theta CCMP2712]|eukprot:XP_005827900.1 hypothetical protein GUITHDRAFT_142321 [Guillardia theta CCMP2712]